MLGNPFLFLAFLFLLIFNSAGLAERSRRLPLLIGWITVGVVAADMAHGIYRQVRPVEVEGRKKARQKMSTKDIVTVVISVGFLLATVLLWWLIGFLLTSLLLTIAYAYYLGSRSRVGLIVAAVLLTAGCYDLFVKLLSVPLPRGLLFGLLF